MRAIRFFISAFLCMLCTVAAYAQTGDASFGLINPAQPTIAGKKVEVIEFFAYYCPHCNALDADITEWVKKQGDNIVFTRVQTSITGQAVAQQRLFYTLEIMGREDEFHAKIMHAIHVEHMHLDSDEDVFDFMTTQGMDMQKFVSAYHSFAVESKVKRALQMQRSYGVQTWPTIVLDGRLFTSPPMAGGRLEPYNEAAAQKLMLNALDQAVANLHQDRSK